MELAIQKAAKTRFGSENDIRAKIDRDKLVDISLHKVINNCRSRKKTSDTEITLENAKKHKT